MIRALHVIDTGGPGGAETVFLQLAARLNPERFRSVAVVSRPGWLNDQLQERAVETCIVPAQGSFNFRYLAALLAITRRRDIDVLVAHLFGSAVYASLLGAVFPIPVISVVHGQTDVPLPGPLTTVKSAIVRKGSRKVVFVSRRLKEAVEPTLHIADSRCVVIPNGVDTGRFYPCRDRTLREELGLPEKALLIGAIGNVRRPKAYEVLLHAARDLIIRSQLYHFVIAGDSSGTLGEELRALSLALGLKDNITFLGLRPDVARILNNLDVFVLSSSAEGFSIACIEAMACGVPVVSTRSGGPEEILEGGAGLLVPTGDAEALADAIEQLTSNQTLTAALTATAMKRVEHEYTLVRMLARYEDLLAAVVCKSGSDRGLGSSQSTNTSQKSC